MSSYRDARSSSLQRMVSRSGLSHVDLFSGIGGFALAARWCGLRTIAFAEVDAFASRVLAKHWPCVPNLGDVRNVGAQAIREPVWLLTGGFPCQPFSVSGKRRGAEDDRALWPEMRRAITELRPDWVLGENVAGIIGMELDNVLADLAGCGYATRVFDIPAVACDARHLRRRVWIVAHAESVRERPRAEEPRGDGSDGGQLVEGAGARRDARNNGAAVAHAGCWQQSEPSNSLEMPDGWDSQKEPAGATGGPSVHDGRCEWPIEPGVGRVADGIPRRVDRLRGLGNAIVPQVAAQIMNAMIHETLGTANDPKLSDGGAWRGSCEGGAQKEATNVGPSLERTRRVRARIAVTVTRGAVRCSAWLGVSGRIRNSFEQLRRQRARLRRWCRMPADCKCK